MTFIIAIIAIPLGFVMGVFFGVMRAYKIKIINPILIIFFDVFRIIPVLALALFFYFIIPQISFLGIHIYLPSIIIGILAIAISTSAFIAEIARGAILSVNHGISDVSAVSGMSHWRVFFKDVFPIAWSRMIPPFSNQCIISFRDISVLSAIGVADLVSMAERYGRASYRTFEVYTTAALLYFIMIMSIILVLRLIERRMKILSHEFDENIYG